MLQLKSIFTSEWLSFKRNNIQSFFIIIITLCSAYAIYYGKTFTGQQLQVIKLVKEEEKSRADKFLSYLKMDTTVASNKEKYEEETGISGADHSLAKYVINYPSGLSSLAIGQRDVYPYYRKVSGRNLYYDGSGVTKGSQYKEITNPEKLLSGNFDFAFVIIYLLPLLIISFTYNLKVASNFGHPSN